MDKIWQGLERRDLDFWFDVTEVSGLIWIDLGKKPDSRHVPAPQGTFRDETLETLDWGA